MAILERFGAPHPRAVALAFVMVLIVTAFVPAFVPAFAGDFADPTLLEEIPHIIAIDNHCHDAPANAARGTSGTAQRHFRRAKPTGVTRAVPLPSQSCSAS